MKVKELIETLQGFDPNAIVVYKDDGGDAHDVDRVHGFKPKQIIIASQEHQQIAIDNDCHEGDPEQWCIDQFENVFDINRNSSIKGKTVVVFAPQF